MGCPDEHFDTTAGHAQISVVCGPTVVVTVVVGMQKSWRSPYTLATPRPVIPGEAAAAVLVMATEVHVAQLPQPGLLITSTVAVHAPLDACRVVVVGGRGVGPVGSPAEQVDVGTMQTGQIPNRIGFVVTVVTGLTHLLGCEAGEARTLRHVSLLLKETDHILKQDS